MNAAQNGHLLASDVTLENTEDQNDKPTKLVVIISHDPTTTAILRLFTSSCCGSKVIIF